MVKIMNKPLRWSETSKEEKAFCKQLFREGIANEQWYWDAVHKLSGSIFQAQFSLVMEEFRMIWRRARQDAYITFNNQI